MGSYKQPTGVQQYLTGTGTGPFTTGNATSAKFRRMQDAAPSAIGDGDWFYARMQQGNDDSMWQVVLATYTLATNSVAVTFDANSSNYAGTESLLSFTGGADNIVLSSTIPGEALALLVPTVANLKALRSRPPSFVLGGDAALNDGLGGIVVWHAGSATGADDIDVFAPTAGAAGRYKRLFERVTASGVVVSPESFSTNAGITVDQVAGGSSAGSFNLNYIHIVDDVDAGASVSISAALQLINNMSSTAVRGGRQGLAVYQILSSPTHAANPLREYVAIAAIVHAETADNGAGSFYAMNPYARAYSGATGLVELTGGEVNVDAQSGSSVGYKAGWSIVGAPTDAVQGSVYDVMLSLSNQVGAVGWNDGILLGPQNGVFPIHSSGAILRTIGGTAAKGVDFASTTITGNAYASSGFSVSGSGALTATVSTFNTGGAAAVKVGVNSGFTTFNVLSFNGVLTDAGFQGVMAGGNANLYLQAASGGSIVFQDGGTLNATLSSTGVLDVGGSYQVNGTQVVGVRDTGWTAMTGTPDENTSYATGSVTLPELAGRVMALQTALTTHGLIGA